MKNRIENDSLSFEDVRKLYKQMEKERLLSRYNLPSKPSSDGYYHVYLADPGKKSGRRQIKARSLDNLKEKIYEYERGLYGNTKDL